MRWFCSLLVGLVVSVGHADTEKLATESYLDMTDVSDALVSPDGKRVVYTRRTVDKINDRR